MNPAASIGANIAMNTAEGASSWCGVWLAVMKLAKCGTIRNHVPHAMA
jgi:hypothetical protein